MALVDHTSQLAARLRDSASRTRARLLRTWQWLRFGDITEIVRSVDGGVVSEVEYRGRGKKIVGYWAYGSFDPAFPYQG